MQAGKTYMERRTKQVAEIAYGNICTSYWLGLTKPLWEISAEVMEDVRAKILWVFQIQTDKLVMANQPEVVLVDRLQRKAVMEPEKLIKYQRLKEEV